MTNVGMMSSAAVLLCAFHGNAAQLESALPEVTLRSDTQLVEFNVTVLDRHGVPVNGLRKEEFVVSDSGVVQNVSVFSEITGDSQTNKSLPQSKFSNQVELSTDQSSRAVILLDWLNTQWTDQARARDRTIDMLGRIGPNDVVAVYVLTRQGLRIIHEFGANNSQLRSQLSRLRGSIDNPEGGRPPVNAIADASVSSIEAALFGTVQDHRTSTPGPEEERFAALSDERVASTLQAFESIAQHLSGARGKKMLIWVSAGFPSSLDASRTGAPALRVYTEQIDRTIKKLSTAGLAVYPVDARGLAGSGTFINASNMEHIATETGGRAFHDRNDIDFGMQSALSHLHLGYTIGYYVGDLRPGLHRIMVRVNRPGVALSFRRSYVVDDDRLRNPPQHHALKRRITSPEIMPGVR